jgi:hypothetical protein
MCVMEFQFRLILHKLHCIIIVMPCMLAYDHADSFAIVVSIASVVYCSDLLLPE